MDKRVVVLLFVLGTISIGVLYVLTQRIRLAEDRKPWLHQLQELESANNKMMAEIQNARDDLEVREKTLREEEGMFRMLLELHNRSRPIRMDPRYLKSTNDSLSVTTIESTGVHLIVQPPYVLGLEKVDESLTEKEWLDNLEARQREFIEAFYINLNHPEVNTLHVLLENLTHLAPYLNYHLSNSTSTTNPWRKLQIHLIQKWMTYSDAFYYANTHLAPGNIAVLANSDIYLGEGWSSVNTTGVTSKTMYALSRHEKKNSSDLHDNCHLSALIMSYDTFVFQVPISHELIEKTNFTMNQWGAENRFLHEVNELKTHKYTRWNPCPLVEIYHYHPSQTKPRMGKESERLNTQGRSRGASFCFDIPPVWEGEQVMEKFLQLSREETKKILQAKKDLDLKKQT